MDYEKDLYTKKVKYIRDINQDSKQNLFNSIKNKNIINNLLLKTILILILITIFWRIF